MTATFNCGNRERAPWHTSAETASSIGRQAESMRNAWGWKGSISLSLPIHSLA